MKKFEILEHTADLKIKAFGQDKKEVFENAILGMFEGARYSPVSSEDSEETETARQYLKVSSSELLSLLVDFLSEVLYLSEVNQEVYDKVDFRVFVEPSPDAEKGRIKAVLSGKKLKSRGVIIKGVTYHDLEVRQLKDGSWEATILFDI